MLTAPQETSVLPTVGYLLPIYVGSGQVSPKHLKQTEAKAKANRISLGFALGFETVVHPPGEKAASLALCKAAKPGDPQGSASSELTSMVAPRGRCSPTRVVRRPLDPSVHNSISVYSNGSNWVP